ncbi:hypothetical protein K458DRAFT_490582 [Lentithecium fluviatile CBS 122367]|uniref:Uncharacterized protein n=1 Tax=Lentithecium fluviatile CBS 122367 TaxID=1168545 RepID=A0A6G1INC4_9PLEO|nr:hypothetical protein K458DRAFT_490582 [Lentithecium fluviatile CBS 122367]
MPNSVRIDWGLSFRSATDRAESASVYLPPHEAQRNTQSDYVQRALASSKLATRSTRTRGRRSRRAPAAQTARGRSQIGTQGQPGGVSLHSHIRVIPHRQSTENNLGHLYEDDTPTFRSQSMQFLSSYDESRRGSATSEGSTSTYTPAATFADMARGYNKKDMEGMERPTSGPMPLAGFVRLQPGRNRKGNKSWRPLQPSDLGGEDGLEGDGSSSPADVSEFRPFDLSRPPSTQFTQTKASPFTSLSIVTGTAAENKANEFSAFPNEDSGETSPTDTRFDVVENYMRLFGKLPDLIRLHEQTGDFDGQIVFIGHPNRDVSAHQWSLASFQWVNIGLWSHTRCRVEGSLASERIPKTGFSYNSIEYFKFAAEQLEKRIKEFGRTKEEPNTTKPRPSLTEADRMASLSTATSSPSDTFPTFAHANRTRETPNARSAGHSSIRNIAREYLEDPFVTPAKPPQPAIPTSLRFRGVGAVAAGSVDFGYQFPITSTVASGPFESQQKNVDPQTAYIQRERDRLETVHRGEVSRDSPAHLREVGFGEEASSAFATPAVRVNINQLQAPLSPEDLHNRQQIKNRLKELGNQARRPSQPTEQRVAIPDVPMLNTNIRSLFPPGPTVANPYRGVSTLNANAAPYTGLPATVRAPEKPESEGTAVNAPPPANLYFSDPDGGRQSHSHEIANGLGQQAPTRQNLNGPFFAESMPTAHDPTASLTFRVSDDEKLVNWFCDGQRPFRQQEYAKSLIATAPASHRPRHFGAIGEGSAKDQDRTKYENTSFFARVLENLSEYAEESRTGVRSSYFTRAWTPTHPSKCDPSPEGNNSFFENAQSTSPQGLRAPARLHSTLQLSQQGGEGRPISGIRTRFGSTADGGYSGY